MSGASLSGVAGGALSAALYLLVVHGSPGAMLLAYFSPLPLFGVGLSFGTTYAGLAGAVATAGIGVSAGALAAALFAVMTAVPAAWLVRYALLSRPLSTGVVAPGAPGSQEWYPPGLLLSWLTGFGVSAVLIAALALTGESGGVEDATRTFLMAAFNDVMPTVIDTEAVIFALARYFPALVVTSWLLMLVINGLFAQSLLARFNRARRPSPNYAALVLPQWLWVPLLAAGTLMVVGSGTPEYLGLNLFIILAIPYFFLGLAVVHTLVRRSRQQTTLIVMFYFVLLLFGWSGFLVAVLGVVEQWMGLRRKYGGRDLTGPEDE